ELEYLGVIDARDRQSHHQRARKERHGIRVPRNGERTFRRYHAGPIDGGRAQQVTPTTHAAPREEETLMRANCLSPTLIAGTLAAISVVPAFADTFDLSWSTIDCGGGTSSGGVFTLSGTIGQADASPSAAMTGGNFSITGGFWPVVAVS